MGQKKKGRRGRQGRGLPAQRPQAASTKNQHDPPIQQVEAQARTQIQTIRESWVGPVPPPVSLAEYNRIVPGSAKAILENFLAEGKHRRRLERIATWTEAIQRIGGLGSALSVSLIALFLAYELFQQGKDGGAIAATLTALAPLVGTLLVYKRRRVEEPEPEEAGQQPQLELQLHGEGDE